MTIKDIAEKAGCAVSTVSRAFTRPELVSKATRAKVLATAIDCLHEPHGGMGAAVVPESEAAEMAILRILASG